MASPVFQHRLCEQFLVCSGSCKSCDLYPVSLPVMNCPLPRCRRLVMSKSSVRGTCDVHASTSFTLVCRMCKLQSIAYDRIHWIKHQPPSRTPRSNETTSQLVPPTVQASPPISPYLARKKCALRQPGPSLRVSREPGGVKLQVPSKQRQSLHD